jgi:hypothetical protein
MACWCTFRKAFGLSLFLFTAGLTAPALSAPDALRAAVNADASAGYARLVFTLADDVDVSVQIAGNVLIISFAKPVLVSVDRLPVQAHDYIAAARRDPDGRAIRLALARKVTVNSIAAGEKFFVDLMPDTWSGAPPGLPRDVVEELARRAKEGERLDGIARQKEVQKKLGPTRVHVASLPTFTRYVFDVPDQTSVSADRVNERLTLTFDAPMVFDLADAMVALPPAVAGINAEVEQDSALVRFSFMTKVDVRTFRDGKGYVVDVVNGDAAPAARDKAAAVASPNLALESGPSAKGNPEGAAPAAISAQPSPAAASRESSKAADAKPDQPAPDAPKAVDTKPAQLTPAPPKAADAKPSPPAAEPLQAADAKAVQPAPEPPQQPADAKSAQPPQPITPASKSADLVAVGMSRQGVNLKFSFPFMAPTAAAAFLRVDTLWLVFDSKASIDVAGLEGEASRTIRGAEVSREGDAVVVRLRLDRPHLSSIAADGPGWTVTIGDAVADPTRALDIARNMIGPNRASISVTFEEPHRRHRIRDPEVGDDLWIVTGFAPARGFVSEQDFVEFHMLASSQGVAIEPLADDVNVELSADKVVISRPGGLTLSSSLQSVLRGSALHPLTFDSQVWGLDRQSTYGDRQSQLLAAAAAAPTSKRLPQRLDLARFYIARDMYAEAKGVLDVALAEDHPAVEDVSANVLRAVAEVMMNRPNEALKDLANPAVGDQHDAPLWRALAYAGQGKWGRARDSFKRVEAAIATLPIELQRVALKYEMRAALEVGDFASAADELNDLETIGLPHDMQPAVSVLTGRLCEGTGRNADALSAYRTAADSRDRPAAAQGQLRELALRYVLGDLKRPDAIAELETLTVVWRGDETEAQALEILSRLYTEEGRYRDAFYVMRSAAVAHPDSDMTRRIQDEAAKTFDMLFLAGKGDALPAIDALALFYDFRELTPIGRRGDEMIRRLTDRLVSVDLLDQAAELLQYQVDHRMQAAARAQVATRLAVIYLMNHKADRALATLRATRTAELANELRNQRLLLEARALSDLGRYDLALEVVGNVEGQETIRLRSDILWAARRWAKSAEQIELYYGERWKEWEPLNEVERADVLRAAIGYALGEDALGLGRFREKYNAKMAQTPDARAFEVVSAPLGTSGTAFRDIAHAAAAVDTLEGFLRDMQARYPDANATSAPMPAPATSAPATTGTVSSAPPPAIPSPPPPAPRSRAVGKTAQR